MMTICKNKKGQGSLVEYSLTIIIAVMAISAMSVYFSRAVQGRIRDGEKHMWREVRDRTEGYYNGLFYTQYEPYYLNTLGTVDQKTDSRTSLVASGPGSSGIFRKRINDRTSMVIESETAPPKEADQEYQ